MGWVDVPLPSGSTLSAHRWWSNGDHPKDGGTRIIEGAVVRYYRHPDHPSRLRCPSCNAEMHDHGWIDDGDGGQVVCPGDWIVEWPEGSFYALHPRPYEAFVGPLVVAK